MKIPQRNKELPDDTLKEYVVVICMKDGTKYKRYLTSTSSIQLLHELTPKMYAWDRYGDVSGWYIENAEQ